MQIASKRILRKKERRGDLKEEPIFPYMQKAPLGREG